MNNTMKVVVFLPCRKGSERVINKNTRTFSSVEGGLARIKFEQLARCREVDCVFLSTDDNKTIQLAEDIIGISDKQLIVDRRPAHSANLK